MTDRTKNIETAILSTSGFNLNVRKDGIPKFIDSGDLQKISNTAPTTVLTSQQKPTDIFSSTNMTTADRIKADSSISAVDIERNDPLSQTMFVQGEYDEVGVPAGLRLDSQAETELAIADITGKKIPPMPTTGNSAKVNNQIVEAREGFDTLTA